MCNGRSGARPTAAGSRPTPIIILHQRPIRHAIHGTAPVLIRVTRAPSRMARFRCAQPGKLIPATRSSSVAPLPGTSQSLRVCVFVCLLVFGQGFSSVDGESGLGGGCGFDEEKLGVGLIGGQKLVGVCDARSRARTSALFARAQQNGADERGMRRWVRAHSCVCVCAAKSGKFSNPTSYVE